MTSPEFGYYVDGGNVENDDYVPQRDNSFEDLYPDIYHFNHFDDDKKKKRATKTKQRPWRIQEIPGIGRQFTKLSRPKPYFPARTTLHTIKVSPAEGKEKQKLESRLRNCDRSSARCAAHCFLVDYLDPATHLETTKLSVKDIYEKYFKNYCDDYLDLKNENVVWK